MRMEAEVRKALRQYFLSGMEGWVPDGFSDLTS